MLSLKLARVKKGWTQEELHKKSGVSRVSICNIERTGIENIPVVTLRKLAYALDTTVSELFFSDEKN
ncbi:helix-turn-helix transcriptional regulator [uncultured Clostridium sp.]|uniref:helix-turn-helix transcriptional regulator n=1 Tax=uncultured Clostridium sp. TaxID=59620 RepID=UPI0025CEBD07|nr:helix-turn-helix transcriptional regulator [uncultured Clostridium sp.]